MKRSKQKTMNPYQRGVMEHSPSLCLKAGQYVQRALGLQVLETIVPEAGDNVFAMWLRAFAEKGILWESLSLQERQSIALDLWLACYQRAVTLGEDSIIKGMIPPMSEKEWDEAILLLQRRCGFEEATR